MKENEDRLAHEMREQKNQRKKFSSFRTTKEIPSEKVCYNSFYTLVIKESSNVV